MAKILNVKNVYDNVELTSAVNIQPYQPRELEVWLPWNVEGVTTRFAFIEVSESGALKLLKEADPMSGRRNTVNRESVRASRSAFHTFLSTSRSWPKWSRVVVHLVRLARQ